MILSACSDGQRAARGERVIDPLQLRQSLQPQVHRIKPEPRLLRRREIPESGDNVIPRQDHLIITSQFAQRDGLREHRERYLFSQRSLRRGLKPCDDVLADRPCLLVALEIHQQGGLGIQCASDKRLPADTTGVASHQLIQRRHRVFCASLCFENRRLDE